MTPRNRRLLGALVTHEKVFVSELRTMVGALNPAQNVLSLRQLGWHIHTGRISVKDRDGNLCRPGFYRLEPKEKERAIAFLKEADGTATTVPSVGTSIDALSETYNTIRRKK